MIVETRKSRVQPGITHRIIQSPMAGCTDLAYRKIARRMGCELAFCEMVKDRPVIEQTEKTLQLMRTADWDHPLGMQVLGRDPILVSEAAKRLEAGGADLVDVNFGCPVNKVTGDGCGSALLKEPAQIGRILEKLVPAVSVPVTIKMRTGFDEGDRPLFLEIVRLASSLGIAALTVHGRTREQMYKGFANKEAIRAAKEAATCPVIGNGDIRSGADAARMLRETGCDGVMVARGALGNPWIYREIAQYLKDGTISPPPSVAERASVLREHFHLLREFYGERVACLHIRRVIVWFVKAIAGGAELRDRGNHIQCVDDFEVIVRDFAAKCEETTGPESAAPGSR